MSDEGLTLLEQYRRRYGNVPTGAALPPAEPTGPVMAFGALASRGFETAAPMLEGIRDVASMPSRLVNTVGTNLAGTAPPLDVSDVVLYGYDVNTGRTPSSYGEALAGELEASGEVAEGSRAAKFIRAAGDLVSDPMIAPIVMSAAKAAGSLLGRYSRGAPPFAPRTVQPRPQSRLHPTSTGMGPGQGPGGGTVTQPPGPTGAVPVRAPGPPRQPLPPTATQPVAQLPPQGPRPPKPGASPRQLEAASRTQPVKTIGKPASPEATQKVKVQKRDVEYRKHQRSRERHQKKLKRDMGKSKEE